ncbi:MAG: superoxide dismutase, Ni [Dehalococcoidia bacterium]|nr:MAG: superoxide dismutase, Ni [Dehalococcoidia bacterium]
MSRSIPGSLVSRVLRTVDRVSPPAVAEAHCDIPCGIYDPHLMQIAALTVVRMNQLIDGLEPPVEGSHTADHVRYHNSLTRYILVKEEHAELVKREARIIWGDYFKPEHVEKYPDLHATVWNIMKLAGKNRQEVNAAAADELLAATHRFAEIFWDSKGAKSSKQPSRQAVGGEIVLPS